MYLGDDDAFANLPRSQADIGGNEDLAVHPELHDQDQASQHAMYVLGCAYRSRHLCRITILHAVV